MQPSDDDIREFKIALDRESADATSLEEAREILTRLVMLARALVDDMQPTTGEVANPNTAGMVKRGPDEPTATIIEPLHNQ